MHTVSQTTSRLDKVPLHTLWSRVQMEPAKDKGKYRCQSSICVRYSYAPHDVIWHCNFFFRRVPRLIRRYCSNRATMFSDENHNLT